MMETMQQRQENNRQRAIKETKRHAVRIFMLSPFYLWLDLEDRKKLVEDFCDNHSHLME